MAFPLSLLGVDLGKSCGLALYEEARGLVSCRSQHFGTIRQLRQAIPSILTLFPGLSGICVEGDRDLGDLWEKSAHYHGLFCLRVIPEQWRQQFFYPREREDKRTAKFTARFLAKELVQWYRTPKIHSLPEDAADAVMVGLWGMLAHGWQPSLPPSLHARLAQALGNSSVSC